MRFSDWSSDGCSSDLGSHLWTPVATNPDLNQSMAKGTDENFLADAGATKDGGGRIVIEVYEDVVKEEELEVAEGRALTLSWWDARHPVRGEAGWQGRESVV